MTKVYSKILQKKLESLRIDILGFPYTVKFIDDLVQRFNVCGCASAWGSEIQVDSTLPNLDTLATIFHEIIETMMRKTETKFDHELISRFEVFLMMLFLYNSELMEIVLDVTKKEGKSFENRRKKVVKELVKGGKGKGRK